MRIDKFLVESSIGTKKAVRLYINQGKVNVNGVIISDVTQDVSMDDKIEYQGLKVVYSGKAYYMFHKPAGCITAKTDENNKTVMDYFLEDNVKSVVPVGRLDKDTEGLLLFTNDGSFNQYLMDPNQHVKKTYFFWAYGSLCEEDRIRLEIGIYLDQDSKITKPSQVIIDKEGDLEDLKEEVLIYKPQRNKKKLQDQKVVSGYITISEGRKHQVKRMLSAVGCNVIYLKRVAIGNVKLDETLKKGEYRALSLEELKELSQGEIEHKDR